MQLEDLAGRLGLHFDLQHRLQFTRRLGGDPKVADLGRGGLDTEHRFLGCGFTPGNGQPAQEGCGNHA